MPDSISPNADGVQDATEIRYSLRRAATVSIYFENKPRTLLLPPGAPPLARRLQRPLGRRGGRTADRRDRLRPAGNPEPRPARRPLPLDNRRREDNGNVAQLSGDIRLQDADTDIPELRNFLVAPQTFRPNQDGLRDDWVSISYYLTKDVDSVYVYLTDPNEPGVKFPIAEDPGVAKTTERGYHEYRYEGGVDLNAEPPPDGTYNIVGEARDLSGNAVRVIRELTIEEGGKPRADIAQGEIAWEGEMNRVVGVPLGDKLCFKAIVTNEGAVPIRTTGPWPSQEYRFSENYNTLAADGHEEWFQQAGVWRFGINFDTTGVDFPYRSGIVRAEDLERRVIDGQEQWYLLRKSGGWRLHRHRRGAAGRHELLVGRPHPRIRRRPQ